MIAIDTDFFPFIVAVDLNAADITDMIQFTHLSGNHVGFGTVMIGNRDIAHALFLCQLKDLLHA